MEKYIFIDDTKYLTNNESFVVHLSGKPCTTEELLGELKEKLKLPEYFGFNWDALYDCLRDFHWIEEKGIILVIDDLPSLEEESLKTYIKILIESAMDGKEGEDHYLQIIFPEASKDIISKIIL